MLLIPSPGSVIRKNAISLPRRCATFLENKFRSNKALISVQENNSRFQMIVRSTFLLKISVFSFFCLLVTPSYEESEERKKKDEKEEKADREAKEAKEAKGGKAEKEEEKKKRRQMRRKRKTRKRRKKRKGGE